MKPPMSSTSRTLPRELRPAGSGPIDVETRNVRYMDWVQVSFAALFASASYRRPLGTGPLSHGRGLLDSILHFMQP